MTLKTFDCVILILTLYLGVAKLRKDQITKNDLSLLWFAMMVAQVRLIYSELN